MRHKKQNSGLHNRFGSWRKATLKALVRSLFIYQSIRTTKSRAKAAQPLVEKVISLGKRNNLSAKREAFKILGEHALVSKVFTDIAPRFEKRTSGFTRVFNLPNRHGDNAKMAILELTEIKKEEHKKVKKVAAIEAKEEVKAGGAAPVEEHKSKTDLPKEQRHPIVEKKPPKKFLGGIKNIFKKERDSL